MAKISRFFSCLLPVVAVAVTKSVVSGGAAEPFDVLLDRARARPVEDRQALVDRWWNSIGSTPLIEDSTRALFLYRGQARRVNLPGDFNSWDKNAFPMFRLDGTDLWYLAREFEPDARLDYKFVIDGSQWILDPANPLTCTGGFGPNSELRMPDYLPPPEIEEHPGIPHGTLVDTTFESRFLGNRRPIQIYLPPGYDAAGAADMAPGASDAAATAGRRYPLILFHDGLEYVSLARADRVLDFLIHHGRIEPALGVFVPPVDRRGEYVGGRRAAFALFIVEELIPWMDGQYRTDPRPQGRAVMGASNGGDISLWLGISHPEVFGHVGAQSTTIRDDVLDRFRNDPRQDLTLYLELGTYDIPGIVPMVRGFIPVLAEKGYRFRFSEYPEGHSWGLWRAHIDDALELFFPVPELSSRSAGSSQGGGTPTEIGASENTGASGTSGSSDKAGAPGGRDERLIEQLHSGSPEQKEAALDFFSREQPVEMVPAVIEAVLDTTPSPRHGDTGWGRVYHQAATALAGFAETIDGVTLKERGRNAYSFYDDVGTATETRRRTVHDRWLRWWRQISAGMDRASSPRPGTVPDDSDAADVPSVDTAPDQLSFQIAPERLEVLRTRGERIESYLATIEQAIEAQLPADGVIPGLEKVDWRGQLRRQQADPDFYGYSVALWRQANGGGLIERQVRCTILCHGQVSLATAGPDLVIDIPARDLRAEWIIRTEEADLDERIRRVVRERAVWP